MEVAKPLLLRNEAIPSTETRNLLPLPILSWEVSNVDNSVLFRWFCCNFWRSILCKTLLQLVHMPLRVSSPVCRCVIYYVAKQHHLKRTPCHYLLPPLLSMVGGHFHIWQCALITVQVAGGIATGLIWYASLPTPRLSYRAMAKHLVCLMGAC